MLDHTGRLLPSWCGLALACWLVSLPTFARAQEPGKPQVPVQRAQGTLARQVDLDRSRTYIKVWATGLGHEHGVVGRLKSGTIALGLAHGAGKLTFDMKSMVADTPEARKQVGLAGETDKSTADQVTLAMLGGRVLDAAKYSTAVFEIDSATKTGDDKASGAPLYQLSGKLTLHGVTKPITIDVQAETVDQQLRLHGSFDILQSDYGIKPYTKLLGTIGVADRLTILGDVWLAPEAKPEP